MLDGLLIYVLGRTWLVHVIMAQIALVGAPADRPHILSDPERPLRVRIRIPLSLYLLG